MHSLKIFLFISRVSGEISVRPGTPLAMKVFLDKGSAPVYGLMVSHLQVSDTVAQQETIVFNGYVSNVHIYNGYNLNQCFIIPWNIHNIYVLYVCMYVSLKFI